MNSTFSPALLLALAACGAPREPASISLLVANHDVADLTGYVPPKTGLRLIGADPEDSEPMPWRITEENLIRLVRRNVLSEAWDEADATLEPGMGFLLVQHRPEVHERLRAFLAHLRTLNAWEVPGWSGSPATVASGTLHHVARGIRSQEAD